MPVPDDWILYRRPGSCYCPIGGCGPIKSELYLRSGVDFPFGHGIYGHVLYPGWNIAGGARALFCNQDMTSAWVVDAGIINTLNQRKRSAVEPVTLTVFEPNAFGIVTPVTFGENGIPGVTIDTYNRTLGSVGLGKEWWRWASPDAPGWKFRWGLDAGGRWGSAKATFIEIRHRTDVVGGPYVAAHFDLEYCRGCCTFYTGLRTEYSYTFSDILQQNNAELQDISIMLTLGVRF
jgi:hypothetical protein